MNKTYIAPDIEIIGMDEFMANPFPGSRTKYIDYTQDPENESENRFGQTDPFGGPNYMGEGDGSNIE